MAAGWGDLTWGFNNWGDQGSVSVEVTGIALSAIIGNEDTQANANVNVTGSRNNLLINSVNVDISADILVTGIRNNISVGSAIASIPATATVTTAGRLDITEGNVTTEGEIREGWGVYTWGTVPWGGAQDVLANVTGTQLVSRIGQEDINVDGNESINIEDNAQLKILVGNTIARTDVSFAVTTAGRLNVSIGEEVVVVNVTTAVTGSRLNTAVGQAVGGTIQEVDVTGSRVNTLIGNTDEFGDAVVDVTTAGRLNVAPGQITYAAGYNVTGRRLNLRVGTVTLVISGSTAVTGSRLNINQGSVNISTWQEVNTGVNNNWTPVDLAA